MTAIFTVTGQDRLDGQLDAMSPWIHFYSTLAAARRAIEADFRECFAEGDDEAELSWSEEDGLEAIYEQTFADAHIWQIGEATLDVAYDAA